MTEFQNYGFRLVFGETEIPMAPNAIEEFSIHLDLLKPLPAVRLKFIDYIGAMTHVMPLGLTSKFSVRLGSQADSDNALQYDFKKFRCHPVQTGTGSASYDISGVLDVKAFLAPLYSRRFNNISDALDVISGDMGISEVRLDPSLKDSNVEIHQPNLSNAEVLNFYASRLRGSGGESGFQWFVLSDRGKTVLNFSSLDALAKQRPALKYVIGAQKAEKSGAPAAAELYYDNYNLMGSLGSRVQDVLAFDWDLGVFMESSETPDRFPSMSQYLNIHRDDAEDSVLMDIGRLTPLDLTGYSGDKAKPAARSALWRRLSRLNQMWVVTAGDAKAVPGQVASVIFAQSNGDSRFQYNGLWLVERVVHAVGMVWGTRLLLSRPGVDIDSKKNLVRAQNPAQQPQ